MNDTQQLIIFFERKKPKLCMLNNINVIKTLSENNTMDNRIFITHYTNETILDKHKNILTNIPKDIPIYIIDYFIISPLWLVNQTKNILSNLTQFIFNKKIDPLNITIWSFETNIEYLNPKIFKIDNLGDHQFIHNEGLIFRKQAFDNISLNISIFEEFTVNKVPIYINDPFIMQHGMLFALQKHYTLETEITTSNIFYSNYQKADYYIMKKCLTPTQKITMFIKNFDMVLMTGKIRVIPDLSIFEDFLIIIEENNEELMQVTENNIYVNDIEFFKSFFLKMSTIKDYVLPERYSTKSRYSFTMPNIIKSSLEDFPFVDNYFIQSSNMKNVMNIITTLDRSIQILLAKKIIRVEMRYIDQKIALYVGSLIYAINQLNDYEEEGYTFGKINGIYWTRICQNLSERDRKPIKIVPSEEEKIILDKKGFIIKKDSEKIKIPYGKNNIYIECNKEIHKDSHHIGFIKKSYKINKTCWPCCFQYEKYDTSLFKNCVSNETTELSSSVYSLFILDKNKQLSEDRIGYLPLLLDKILNDKLHYNAKNKRLSDTEGFHFISGNNSILLHGSEDDLYEFFNKIDNNNKIILYKGMLIYTPLITTENFLYVYIKEYLYPVIFVKKEKGKDKIHTSHIGLPIDFLLKKIYNINNKNLGNLEIDNFISIQTNVSDFFSIDYLIFPQMKNVNINIAYNFNTEK